MPDRKPTLEYGRPHPKRKRLDLWDFISLGSCLVFIILGTAFVVLWILSIIRGG
jgi:hypothetical protein